MSDGGQTVPRITKAEHIGPADTGDNIEAKRVALYYWDGSNWQRATTATFGGNTPPSTSTVTSVNDTAISTTLLALNASRKEVIITNDSSSTLYMKLGTTASATDYTVKLGTDDVFTTTYTGRIDGLWSSDSTGAARITELT